MPENSRAALHSWDEFSERQWAVLDEIEVVGEELDATPAQVALRWLIQQEPFTCVPIIGAQTADQLVDNVGATEIEVSNNRYDRIAAAYETE